MGYDHTTSLAAQLKEGIPLDKVWNAIDPIMEYEHGEEWTDKLAHGENGCVDFYGSGTEVHLSGSLLSLYMYGYCSYEFIDLVEEVAKRLNAIAAAPGEITHQNHDVADSEEGTTVLYFGPSEEVIRDYVARKDLDKAFSLMEKHIPAAVLQVAKNVVLGRFEIKPVVFFPDGKVDSYAQASEARAVTEEVDGAVMAYGVYVADKEGFYFQTPTDVSDFFASMGRKVDFSWSNCDRKVVEPPQWIG